MKYGAIDGVEKRISRLVLGSAGLQREDDGGLAVALLERFAEAGGTAVDTAFSYGRGASERAIGRWLRDYPRRDEIAVITKGAHPVEGWEMRVNPEAIRSDMAQSLERLGVAIDVYLLHRDDPTVPVGPIVDCLDEAWRQGNVRAYGGSNWSTERIEAANAYAREHGKHPFVVSSPNVALAVPKEPPWPGCVSIAGDEAARAWYAREQMPVLSWSSGARGFFAGRAHDKEVARVYDTPENHARLARARELAARRGTPAPQVALAWVLHQPFPTFALIGPMTVGELEENLGAAELDLAGNEVDWLQRGV